MMNVDVKEKCEAAQHTVTAEEKVSQAQCNGNWSWNCSGCRTSNTSTQTYKESIQSHRTIELLNFQNLMSHYLGIYSTLD